MRSRVLPLLGVLVLLLGSSARADAITFTLVGRKLVGQGDPELQVHIHERINGFELTLQRSDGKKVVKRGGGRPGSTQTVRLPQPEGAFHYEGELVAVVGGQRASVPLAFDTEVAAPPRITYREEDLDVAARRFRFQLTRPASKAHLTVQTDSGAPAWEGDIPFNGEAPGTPLEVTWPEQEGTVLRVEVRAFDTSDNWIGVELFPWWVGIPHEEVQFATGKADLRPEEVGKLQAALELLRKQVENYSRWTPIRLYVLGHTDTVGGTADNRALSLRRARAIATWFRKQGVRIPIYVEGFGEEWPRVATEDETDEVQNRRVDYILSPQDFRQPAMPFKPAWKKL